MDYIIVYTQKFWSKMKLLCVHFFSPEALSISRKHSDSSETMSLNFFPSSPRNLLSTTTTNHTNNKNLMMTLLLEKLLLPNNLI